MVADELKPSSYLFHPEFGECKIQSRKLERVEGDPMIRFTTVDNSGAERIALIGPLEEIGPSKATKGGWRL